MWWEVPNHLEVKKHELYIGGMNAEEIARKHGTPLYVYNGNRIVDNYRRIRDSLEDCTDKQVRVYYAVKANSSLAVLQLLAREGAWADTVSPCEAHLCIDSDFPRKKILFTGTAISNEDMREIDELGVMINIDSVSQLRRLSRIVNPDGYRISIRWNPGVSIKTHKYLMTAKKGAKFGVPEKGVLDACREAKNLGFNLVGLHQHIGSNWHNCGVFLKTVDKTLDMAREITGVLERELEFVDFGGGPGIPYTETDREFDLDEYGRRICEKVKNSDLGFKAIAIEPGRYIVGDAGILLTEINTVANKGVEDENWIAGVNSDFWALIRPVLYDAFHWIGVCNKTDLGGERPYTVAGDSCESGGKFGENRRLPDPQEGEILAIFNAGAYGYCMSSNYNSRLRPPEVMILDGKDFLIRGREEYKDLLRGQLQLPDSV